MDYDIIKEKLSEKINKDRLIRDASMAKETTFRCGGNGALFVIVDNLEELRYTLSVIKAFGAKWMILGNGSNVLFTDKGYDGVVIRLGKEFTEIVIEGDVITAGAGAMLSYISKVAAAKSLTGLEFASGIPGSLGGGIYMDAGAYGGSMADVLTSVTAVTPEGDIYKYDKDELELSYRHSRFMDSNEVIIEAKMRLCQGNIDEIHAKMDELTKARKEKQPLSYPSAGSFFKRPEGHFAGALIEQAGLKGYTVGGAQVSELHAGFVINKGGATASDVLSLMKDVQNKVYEMSGVCLEPEVRIIGDI